MKKLKFYLIFLFSISCLAGSRNIGTRHSYSKQLYYNKCGSCHKLRNPQNYTKVIWHNKLQVHKKLDRINLTQEDWEHLEHLTK